MDVSEVGAELMRQKGVVGRSIYIISRKCVYFLMTQNQRVLRGFGDLTAPSTSGTEMNMSHEEFHLITSLY